MKFCLAALALLFNCLAQAQLIGYGSANSALPAKNQELFFRGFKMALSNQLGDARTEKLLITDQVTDHTQNGALKSVKRLLARPVSMLVGYPTSHEALQVAPVTSKENVLTLFLSAGHSKLNEYGNAIFTTGESMSNFVEISINNLKKHFPNKSGLFIYNPEAVFTVNQKENFEKAIQGSAANGVKLKFSALTKNLEIPEAELQELKSGVFSYVFFSTYPDESVSAFDQLLKNKISLPVISNSSWTTGDIEFVRRSITEFKAPIYTSALWIPGSPTSLTFERLYKAKFGISPSTESAAGFNAGVIIAEVIQRAGSDLSRGNILKAFLLNPCFKGTAIGQICFNPSGGFSKAKIQFVRLSKTGFGQVVK